jgi:glycosyltransferase involved in cell wall biosynthesis
MQTEKIDVCVCTRDGKLPQGLENIPINKLIINKDKPIGIARMNCIKEVTTPIFAFIDDDMIIDEYWFNMLYPIISKEDIGAVCGITTGKGFGWFSPYFYDAMGLKELKFGERIYTGNTLIKTEYVKDWVPTYGLNCYEDLEIGNHIMNKGYNVMFVPSTTIHYKSWKQLSRTAKWSGYRYREVYKQNVLHITASRVLAIFKVLILRGIPASIYVMYRNFWFLIGLYKKELGFIE